MTDYLPRNPTPTRAPPEGFATLPEGSVALLVVGVETLVGLVAGPLVATLRALYACGAGW